MLRHFVRTRHVTTAASPYPTAHTLSRGRSDRHHPLIQNDAYTRPRTVARVSDDLVLGADDKLRCGWGASNETYVAYHDEEWGRAVRGDNAVYERLCLEGFQAGLSWITILRKRESFRSAFADFDPVAVAAFDTDDVKRLLNDAGIVRHRGKIEATIGNAQAVLELQAHGRSISDIVWSYRDINSASPSALAQVPAKTEASIKLSKELIRHGFRFVGPTTMYAAMQAMGIVNDHIKGCHVREECERTRS